MEKPTVYLFSSPTCPNCQPAKRFIHEFKKTRKDFLLKELSTASHEGNKKAGKFGVMAVPTFIIRGPGYLQPIGLVGLQSEKTMNKYLDMSLGIEEEEKNKLKRKIKKRHKNRKNQNKILKRWNYGLKKRH